MKTKMKKNHTKKYVAITVVVLLLTSLIVGASWALRQSPAATTPPEVTDSQPAVSEPSSGSEKTTGNTDSPPAPTAPEDGVSRVEILMTAQSQDTSSAVYRLRYNISALVSNGTCSLSLTKEGRPTITKTADTFQSGATTSTCTGFDIPLSELSPGAWTAQLKLTSSEYSGETTNTVTVN